MSLLGSINFLDDEEILSDELYLELFKEESEINKVRYEQEILKRAKVVGKLTEVKALLSAYKKDIKKFNLKAKNTKSLLEFNSILTEIDSWLFEKIADLKPEEFYNRDDCGNGELFADIFKDKCRYNVTAKEWYVYNGKIWQEDTGGMEVRRLAKKLADALQIYSLSIKNEEVKDKYKLYVAKLGQHNSRKTMVEDAKDKYFISSEVLDQDLYLLNCQNCVLNLKTFEVIEHSPDLLLSKITNVEYNKEAPCNEWEKFMNEIMLDNNEKVDYLQKILGYSLTGDTKEETCYILYGSTTRNGKSTLVETISYMLGGTEGYSMNMKPESLASKQNNDSRQANGDIARLKGTRFLNASEPPKRMVFDIGLLKTLLGRDSITARHLHEREFQFIPCFKLFMNTNFLPLITDDTIFSSGRINVITFDRHFNQSEQDKKLKDRLKRKDNLSGILNWCLAGLKKYYEVGAIPPASVVNATEEYRNSSDKIGNFIAERLEASELNSKAKDIYDAYQDWCKDNGYGAENKGNFYADLRTKGIWKKRGTVRGKTIDNIVVGYILSHEYYPIDSISCTQFY